jgi:hypothetical protein
MSISGAKHAFFNAILLLIPGAILDHVSRSEWQSATFTGERIILTLILSGDDTLRKANALQATLPDHEFELSRWLVADILVSNIETVDSSVSITIEALLLRE